MHLLFYAQKCIHCIIQILQDSLELPTDQIQVLHLWSFNIYSGIKKAQSTCPYFYPSLPSYKVKLKSFLTSAACFSLSASAAEFRSLAKEV